MHFIRNCINSKSFNLLWSKDQVYDSAPEFKKRDTWDTFSFLSCFVILLLSLQLTMMKKKIPRLQQFEEGPLDFQPTYKFDLNSDKYDSRWVSRERPLHRVTAISHYSGLSSLIFTGYRRLGLDLRKRYILKYTPSQANFHLFLTNTLL